MRKKKKNRILFLFLVLLAISIGYAALTANLKIHGITNIAKNTWNIYWDNVHNESGVTPTTPTAIGADENSIPLSLVSFDVTFNKPGEFYEFEVDAVNAGTIDAEVLSIEKKYNNTVIPKVIDNEHPDPMPSYLKFTIKYVDGTDVEEGDRLEKRTSTTVFTKKTYKIRVEYDKSAVTISDINNQSDAVTHTFDFKVQYGQATRGVALATDSWKTIIAEGVEAAKQATVTNNKCGPYHVGDTREITVSGLGTHTVRIANCSTPAVCETQGFSQSACGFVIEFADIITTHKMNPYVSGDANGDGNTGGWEYSNMRAYLNGLSYVNSSNASDNVNYASDNIYNKLPQDLRNKIVPTTVVSSYGPHDASSFTTSDKLYLLSSHEVWLDDDDNSSSGIDSYYDNAYSSTRQLDYYAGLGVTTSSNYASAIKKNSSNNSANWRLRTAHQHSDYNFGAVSTTGEWATAESYVEYGVSPAFKLG